MESYFDEKLGKTVLVLPTKKDPRVKSRALFRSRSKAGNVRGRTVDARRKAVVAGESPDGQARLVKSGMMVATDLFYIKSGVDGAWGDFKRFCRRFDLDWKFPAKPLPKEERWYEVKDDGKREDVLPEQDLERPLDEVVAVEVSGRARYLRELKLKRFVARWERCLDTGAPRFTSKGGHWSP